MPIYTEEQLLSLKKHGPIPRHIAIIPDGNRRWAKLRSANFDLGHQAGANVIIDIVHAAREIGVGAVTFYLFSTENWSRSRLEISALMWLLKAFLRDHREEMVRRGVRLKTIGDLSRLPSDVVEVIEESIEMTAHSNQIDMVLALNYGSRDEIRRTIQHIVTQSLAGELPKGPITEAMIATYLDTAPWGDPELLIRTSGEYRLSNFMLWQISYTEFYVTDTLWPDFTPHHLLEALIDFQKRERRLGGTQ